MAQYANPKIVTDGLVFNLDTLGGRGSNKIITKPTQIDGCTLWLDADDGDSVIGTATWVDKSGQGHNLVSTLLESSGASAPVLTENVINGRSAMKFDGTDDYMRIVDTLDVSATSGFTQFFVFRNVAAPSTCVVGGLAQAGASSNFVQLAEDKFGFGGGGTATVVSSAVRPHTPFIVMGRRVSGSGTLAVDAKWNGVSYAGTTSAYGTVDRFHIGGNSYDSGSQYYNGYICEVIVYNTNLSDTQVEQVELYLSRKWNIVLPTQSRTYANPANAAISNTKYGKLDQVGNALYFMGGPNTTGGYKDYINCGRVLEPGGTYGSGEAFSLEAWACSKSPTRDGSSWKTIIGSSSNAQINFYGASAVWFMKNGGGNGGSNKITATTQLHQWHHIVGTFEGGTSTSYSGDIATGPDLRKLYVDGEHISSDKETFYGGNITENYIGSYHVNGLERGPMELAVARIYKKQLSHAEIKQNYNAQKARIDAIPKIPKPGNLALYLDAGLWESYKGSGSGATWYDLSGNGNNGTINNAVTYDTTLPENDMGKSFDFDGSNDYVEVSDAGTLEGFSKFTFVAWVKPDATSGYRRIFDKGYSTTYNFSIQNTDKWYFYVDGSYALTTSDTVDEGEWNFLVGTYDGTSTSNNVNFYRNGAYIETATLNQGTVGTNSSSLIIGRDITSGSDMSGAISVVMIYNTELSAKEVKQLYDYFKHRYGK